MRPLRQDQIAHLRIARHNGFSGHAEGNLPHRPHLALHRRQAIAEAEAVGRRVRRGVRAGNRRLPGCQVHLLISVLHHHRPAVNREKGLALRLNPHLKNSAMHTGQAGRRLHAKLAVPVAKGNNLVLHPARLLGHFRLQHIPPAPAEARQHDLRPASQDRARAIEEDQLRRGIRRSANALAGAQMVAVFHRLPAIVPGRRGLNQAADVRQSDRARIQRPQPPQAAGR